MAKEQQIELPRKAVEEMLDDAWQRGYDVGYDHGKTAAERNQERVQVCTFRRIATVTAMMDKIAPQHQSPEGEDNA